MTGSGSFLLYQPKEIIAVILLDNFKDNKLTIAIADVPDMAFRCFISILGMSLLNRLQISTG